MSIDGEHFDVPNLVTVDIRRTGTYVRLLGEECKSPDVKLSVSIDKDLSGCAGKCNQPLGSGALFSGYKIIAGNKICNGIRSVCRLTQVSHRGTSYPAVQQLLHFSVDISIRTNEQLPDN